MEQYNSIQQLLKKEGGKKNPVFPPTVVQAVFDAKTGASLEAILAQFNSVYLQYQGSPKATRLIIPKEMRRAGLTITYMNMEGETITERAASAVQKDNDNWGLDINWSRVDELSLSGDISVSAKGTWIINGHDTGVKAVGPKGDAGLTPWLKTIDNRLHLSYDNVNWEPCSDPIAAYFRWSSNKIQISRDNKTWTDLSGTFADNLYIKGYVATTSALPSSAAQGDIYGVGPTYAAEDTARTNPIYRYYVRNAGTWVDNGPFTSIAAGVVQEPGDSETEVMSQKAVSEKLSELSSKVYNNISGAVYDVIGYINTEGNLIEVEDWVSTQFIAVSEGDKFYIDAKGAKDNSATQEVSLYDSSKIFIGRGNSLDDSTYTVGQGAAFIKLTGKRGYENRCIYYALDKYEEKILGDLRLIKNDIVQKTLNLKLQNVTLNHYTNRGEEKELANCAFTDYIEVSPSSTYIIEKLWAFAFVVDIYNSKKEWVETKATQDGQNGFFDLYAFNTPSSARYIRINYNYVESSPVLYMEGMRGKYELKNLITDKGVFAEPIRYNKIAKPLPVENGNVLLAFGDSITAGHRAVSTYEKANEGNYKYIEVLANRFGLTLKNYAVSGATLTDCTSLNRTWMYNIIVTAAEANINPNIIIVAIGINDYMVNNGNLGKFGDTNSTFYGEYQRALDLIKSTWVDVPVIVITPINYLEDALNNKLELFRKAAFEVAAINDCSIINGETIPFPTERGILSNMLLADNLHPTSMGHKFMGDAISGFIG